MLRYAAASGYASNNMLVKCLNCGNGNTPGANFCRFCGTKFNYAPKPAHVPHLRPQFEEQPPRPYSWKTDEFTVKSGSSTTPDFRGGTIPGTEYLQHNSPGTMTYDYRCPRCMSPFLPILQRKISTAGWVTFAILAFVFLPLCWIGLLFKEDVRVCPACGGRTG